jgi:hypothetical protein
MQVRALKPKRSMLAALAIFAVSGCTAGPSIDDCVLFRPIYPTAEDACVISDRLADAIVVHNETGEKRCGWKAPTPKPGPALIC